MSIEDPKRGRLLLLLIDVIKTLSLLWHSGGHPSRFSSPHVGYGTIVFWKFDFIIDRRCEVDPEAQTHF